VCGAAYPVEQGTPVFAEAIARSYDGYDPQYFPRFAAVEERNFWFRNRNALIQEALRRYFPAGGDLLEIGCGTGFVLRGIRDHLPAFRLSGSEIYLEGLAFARSRVPEASFYQVDARRLPFRRAFDVIGAFDVIEHIDEDVEVLAQMRRALKDGGGLVLTVPQHSWLWTPVDELSGHRRRYSARELISKVRGAGFEVLYTTSFVSVLTPALFLSRLMNKNKVKTLDDVMRQFEIGDVTNAILFSALAAERALLRVPGFRLPVGSSRLLVAKAAPAERRVTVRSADE
jgi:SAM-dependent methyltransferase